MQCIASRFYSTSQFLLLLPLFITLSSIDFYVILILIVQLEFDSSSLF